jgi:methylglyoxal synthase
MRIALVAHDAQKPTLYAWVRRNHQALQAHEVTCTASTAEHVDAAMRAESGSIECRVHRLKSGPAGGDKQLGALVADGCIDLMVFLWDPTTSHPHDADVRALLRVAVLYNVPTACNRATADALVPLFMVRPTERPTGRRERKVHRPRSR